MIRTLTSIHSCVLVERSLGSLWDIYNASVIIMTGFL